MKSKIINLLIIILIFIVFLLLYFLIPSLSNIRELIGNDIYIFAFISILILYFTYSNDDLNFIGKIINTTYLILLFILKIINFGKFKYICLMIYAIINLLYSLYLYKKTKKEYKCMYFVGFFAYLQSTIISLRVKHVDTNFPFWLPSLVISLLLAMISIIYLLNRYKKDGSKENMISLPLCFLLVGFCFSFLTISSLNIIFDMSKPEIYRYKIIDMDVDGGGRRITSYELTVFDGSNEFVIDVSKDDYNKLKIGDIIELSLYQGAFNVSYYIYERT